MKTTRLLQSLRKPLPRRPGRPHSTKRGARGSSRTKAQAELRRELTDTKEAP